MATYRYNFSKEFLEKAYAFSEVHKLDSINDFKKNLNDWMNNNIDLIRMETRALENKGYKKDIYEKVFKTTRYYLKNVNKKKKAKTRRNYISLSREFLNCIDKHVITCYNKKPSIAYSLFENNEIININKEKQHLLNYLSDDECNKKIKKTYKNRLYYYINN
tara:strand:- start:117 stop:602 length:486 start_codon:yes stop_codon:yes gene_type:complete